MRMRSVRIGDKAVGPGEPCYTVAEIGINHNGNVKVARKLIDAAAECGCDAVKFQKRTVEVVYTKEELERSRESPFGNTNGDLKRGLEFGKEEYRQIDAHCREKGIPWFASARAFAAKLSLQHAFFGVKQKADVLRDLMPELRLDDDEVCFMGDDINDIQAMSIAGLAATVPHAARRVLSVADWVNSTPAGSGAVREFLAEAQGFVLE